MKKILNGLIQGRRLKMVQNIIPTKNFLGQESYLCKTCGQIRYTERELEIGCNCMKTMQRDHRIKIM